MGDNTLRTAADGEIIPSTDTTQYKEALVGDILPRESSGVVVDEAGSIGDSSRRWANVFSGLLNVENDAEVGGNITAGGDFVAGAPIITTLTTTGLQSFFTPVGVRYVKVELIGGGGSGGSQTYTGGSTAASGAGGGSYVCLGVEIMADNTELLVTVGSGASGVSGASNGGAGGGSYLVIDGVEIAVASGGSGGRTGSSSAVSGGNPKIRVINGSLSSYYLNDFSSSVGGSSASEATPSGYSSGGSTNGGGASMIANGGNGYSSDSNRGGGGGGYSAGGSASSVTSGSGGNGAVIITYYKGVRS